MPDAVAAETVAEPVANADHPLDGFDAAAVDADESPAETVAADAGDAVATEEATDATEPQTPAVEATDTTPTEPAKVEEPGKPAETKPPEPDAKTVEAQQKAEAAFQKWSTSFSEELATLDSLKPDDVLESPAKVASLLTVAVKGLHYARQAINEQAAKIAALETGRTEETYWKTFQRQTPEVPIAKAQDIWSEELTKAKGSYKNEAAAQAVATERFKDRIAIIKGQAKKPAAPPPAATKPKPATAPSGKPKPPVTKGGGNAMPKAGSTHQPKAPAREPEDEFAAMVGQAGVDSLLERM